MTDGRLASGALRLHSIEAIASHPDHRYDAADMTHRCDETPVRDQEATGSCWAQAGLGMLQVYAGKSNIKVKLSISHLLLHDKWERARVFVERAMHERNTRIRWHLMQEPIEDGGTWPMFVHVVNTYGVVTDAAMPSTYQAKHTGLLNKYLNRYLRSVVRPLQQSKVRSEDVLAAVWEALTRCFGNPPSECRLTAKTNELEWSGKPQALLKRIAPDIGDFSVIAHAPDRPLGPYIGPYSNSIDDPSQDRFTTVRMRELVTVCIRSLQMGLPVWFTADVRYDFSARRGMADIDLFHVEDLLGISMSDKTSKTARLIDRNSAPVHAMLITGVRLDDQGKPIAWRIQNSWGTAETGQDGFVAVTHAWFREYVFHVVDMAPRAFDDQLAVPLKPWDVFATVAS